MLPKGTSMQVEITRQYPMKAGEAIEGRLMHPIYADGRLAVPQNTLLRGKVVALEPDKKTRLNGRLRGDFTPFDTAEVQFDELMLPQGPVLIAAATASNGAPVLHLSAPGATPRRSFIAANGRMAKARLARPGGLLYRPGAWRSRPAACCITNFRIIPQRIAAHTAWTFELTAPLALPDPPSPCLSRNRLRAVRTASRRPGRFMPC